MSKNSDLKGRVLKGGISLTIRQILVSILSLSSVLITARVLGPENYGLVTVALGIFYFLTRFSRLGIHIFIVRQPQLDEKELIQIKAFYLTTALVVCGLLWLGAPAIGWWTKSPEVTTAFRWLLPGLLMHMASITSMSMLERELRFVEVGLIEALAQAASYGLAIALVLSGWGYISLVIGTVVRFTIQAVASHWFHPIRWSLLWQWPVIAPALRYGATFSVSDWLLSLQRLRVSLLVSRFIGVEAAGIVGISIRLVEQLSMLRIILSRMSISVMAKLSNDPEKTRRVISKGMAYQALLNGSICALFSVSSVWVIPLMFDERWLDSAQIFPFIAVGTLVLAIFNLHSSTLYAAGHNRSVAIFNFIYVGALWVMSALLTPYFGIWGYGISEVAVIPVFFLLHYYIKNLYGSPNYWSTLWIFLATIIPLFGGIALSPAMGTVLFVLSFGLLFLLCKNVRKLCQDLWQSKLKKA